MRANANNIGFAIPINMVKQLLPMLIRDGKIRRSAIGVTVDALNAIEARPPAPAGSQGRLGEGRAARRARGSRGGVAGRCDR